MAKKGYKFTEEHKKNLSLSHIGQISHWKGKKRLDMVLENNPAWKGDKVGYHALHRWISNNYGKPNRCDDCGDNKLPSSKYQWANINGLYKRDISDWKRLCLSCHRKVDTQRKAPRIIGRGNSIRLVI